MNDFVKELIERKEKINKMIENFEYMNCLEEFSKKRIHKIKNPTGNGRIFARKEEVVYLFEYIVNLYTNNFKKLLTTKYFHVIMRL